MQRVIMLMLILLTTLSLVFSTYLYLSRPKLAYVRSHDLINRYAGTVEARNNFESKKSAMIANVDSLRMMFEKSRMEYLGRAAKLSSAARASIERELNQQQSQFIQYSQAIDERISQEDNEMMGAVLNQVNSFVEDYAKSNNIDVILGTTTAGSLLYGESSIDITEPLLESLNEKYKGK
jgi:outer membrane protein